ncbi:MAG: TonB family protein [Candidatus Tectomicrobia bacterium]|uniref:TonB family protein n=1 Tax=Tectimicrobiota bacterium TaxID=2528274 RepID=A0A932GRN0_UNCTE|nr:TonB family protein [Candidatus Tectomicrobia bacterium]
MALPIAHLDSREVWSLKGSFVASLATHLTLLTGVAVLSLSAHPRRLIFSPVTTVNLVAALDIFAADRARLGKKFQTAGKKSPTAPSKSTPEAEKSKPDPAELPQPVAAASAVKPAEIVKPALPKPEEKAANQETTQKDSGQESRALPPGTTGAALAGLPTSSGLSLDAANFPFGYYLVLLHRRISENWDPGPLGKEMAGEKVTVFFRILKNGALKDVQIEEPASSAALNRTAMRAVTAGTPFPPLPEDFTDDSLGVHFLFELPSTM